jgi:hypothetical protein
MTRHSDEAEDICKMKISDDRIPGIKSFESWGASPSVPVELSLTQVAGINLDRLAHAIRLSRAGINVEFECPVSARRA